MEPVIGAGEPDRPAAVLLEQVRSAFRARRLPRSGFLHWSFATLPQFARLPDRWVPRPVAGATQPLIFHSPVGVRHQVRR
jgi:hypothetical protein